MAKRKGRARPASSEWDALEAQVLAQPRVGERRARGRAGPGTEFDTTEQEVLQRLAARSRLLRARAEPLGNVVFLHGITGSDLSVSRGGAAHRGVWVDIPRLILGGLSDLMLAGDGKNEAEAVLKVQPTGVNKRFYARAVLALRAQWNVETFAYDWRKDIDEASDGLAALIKARFPDEPVHLVAHSMGGLVARNMIRLHPKVWESMRHADLTRGGRLVMLGTPNYGSYAIAQVLTGTDALLTRLERFDLRHNLTELLRITNTFLGTYQLLPAFGKLPTALQRLYESATWGFNPGVSQRHLDRALKFYNALDTSETIDSARMVYIAGTNQPTIKTLRIAAPGEFEYEFTHAGDGRVPHELGLLTGVNTLYVEEVHGDLARNESILRTLDEVLQKGTTEELSKVAVVRAPPVAEVGGDTRQATLRQYRAGADRAALDVLEAYASRTRAAGTAEILTLKEQQLAGDAMIHAALGARTPLPPAEAEEVVREQVQARVTPVADRMSLKVGVRFGRIEEFEAPVVVVGHYRGVKPVNAIGAIDRRLGNWISRAVKRGMISGHVGETFFVPVPNRKQIAAGGVVVAGMGDYGQFSSASLSRVMANVAQGAAALQLPQIATVLIGAGEGSLNVQTALQSMLDGFSAGLLELRAEQPDDTVSLHTLWIVELDPKRFTLIDKELRRLVEGAKDRSVQLTVVSPPAGERTSASRRYQQESRSELRRVQDAQPKFNEVRLTVECIRDDKRSTELFRMSALTDNAVVAAREIELTRGRAEAASKALAEAEGRAEQTQYGRLLFDYLMPEDFQRLFDTNADTMIRLIVDPTSAALPWEMACFPDAIDKGKFNRFGTDRRLTRQFRTLLSRTPGVMTPRMGQVRALVIADPASDPEWRLPGARAEGRQVATLLRNANRVKIGGGEERLDIVVEERIGFEECQPIELRALINSGDFDIVHFAGHGDYQRDDPATSGWVLDDGEYLTANDIFRARKVPWLIVANACFSGALRQSEAYPNIDVARRGASIAEAFMERGVPNYLGTGWTVDDSQALLFAKLFYGTLLENKPLGDAVARAREKLFEKPTGSTWGAYQFYGDPGEQLLKRGTSQAAPEPARRAPRKRKATAAKRAKRGKRARSKQ